MQGTPESASGGLDPREAARLLEQTRREAQRKLDLSSPLLSVLGAAVVLVALGAVWLSVRGQHPYKGPTAAGLLVMYGILACWIGVVVTFRRRATAGVSGRSIRQQRAYAAAVVTALVGVSVFQGVLKHDGASLAIVYGIYPRDGAADRARRTRGRHRGGPRGVAGVRRRHRGRPRRRRKRVRRTTRGVAERRHRLLRRGPRVRRRPGLAASRAASA